jgi:mono/diheme cytochrome c family protein
MSNKYIPTSKNLALTAIAAVALSFTASADESKLPPAATKANVTFATDIKPIFDTSCVKCHGDEKPKAGLKLTSLETTLKGTKEGKVVEPGNSTKSSLVLSVAYIGEEDHWMPPKNNKAKIAPLTKEQVGLVRAWVDQGAK